jgi:hypothetical protein
MSDFDICVIIATSFMTLDLYLHLKNIRDTGAFKITHDFWARTGIRISNRVRITVLIYKKSTLNWSQF